MTVSGFMCGSTVLDKDGVSAAVVTAEMAAHLAEQGVTLHQQLHKIYSTYVVCTVCPGGKKECQVAFSLVYSCSAGVTIFPIKCIFFLLNSLLTHSFT